MLGKAADAFNRVQSRERIVAAAPNGDGRSLSFPDREAPGTGKVTAVKGSYETPGPQTVVDANTMLPGMGAYTDGQHEMLPGMGAYTDGQHEMLPGMGSNPGDMLPGMGNLMENKTLIFGGIAVVGLLWLLKKRRG